MIKGEETHVHLEAASVEAFADVAEHFRAAVKLEKLVVHQVPNRFSVRFLPVQFQELLKVLHQSQSFRVAEGTVVEVKASLVQRPSDVGMIEQSSVLNAGSLFVLLTGDDRGL